MTNRALTGLDRTTNQSPPPLIGTFRATASFNGGDLDVYDNGKFKIVGTTKIIGTPATPARVRVSLHDQISGRLVRSQWSNALTGAYSFLNIRLGAFYVLAFDHTGVYRAVIADNQTPEPM